MKKEDYTNLVQECVEIATSGFNRGQTGYSGDANKVIGNLANTLFEYRLRNGDTRIDKDKTVMDEQR